VDRAARESRPILLAVLLKYNTSLVDRLVKPCYNAYMNKIDPALNPLEVLVVTEALAKKGITHYSLLPGNDCIWASYNTINEYYIFSQGLLVDVQID
jgi:hypothetical protein